MIAPEDVRSYCHQMGFSEEYGNYAAMHLFCEVCGEPARLPHHILTRGAHGNIDAAWNLLSLCTQHHIDIDSMGNTKFCREHPQVTDKIDIALKKKAAGVAG